MGFAYELGATRPVDPGTATERNAFHGPRLTPSFGFTPFSLLPFEQFPAGHYRGTLELEVPVSGWFGIQPRAAGPPPPHFVVAPAVGLNLNFAM
jgi:hypothetical protein